GAAAATPNCARVKHITDNSCFVISEHGCYMVDTGISATSDSGDCIQISASNVVLEFGGTIIAGTGASSTGVGIHVLAKDSTGAAIRHVIVTAHAGSPSGAALVNKFNTGVLLEASDSKVDGVRSFDNNGAGFVLKAVTTD